MNDYGQVLSLFAETTPSHELRNNRPNVYDQSHETLPSFAQFQDEQHVESGRLQAETQLKRSDEGNRGRRQPLIEAERVTEGAGQAIELHSVESAVPSRQQNKQPQHGGNHNADLPRPASNFDRVDRLRIELQRINKEFKTHSTCISAAAVENEKKRLNSRRQSIIRKDTVALRQKLATLRDCFQKTSAKIDELVHEEESRGTLNLSASKNKASWVTTIQQIESEKCDFEKLDRDVRLKEKANPLTGARPTHHDYNDNDGYNMNNQPENQQQQDQIHIPGFKNIDMNEMEVEENIQREKLEAVVQIEQDVNEIKSMYSEFNDHLEIQQPKLDVIETNVEKSTTRVEGGVVHLQQAQQSQKSSRKKTCCLLFLLLIGVALAIGLFLIFK